MVKDAAAGRHRGRLARAVKDLEELLAATRQFAAQTRRRLAEQTPEGSKRRVSLHDPDARPMVKGRLGKPVEFGAKAQLVEGDDGIIVDHTLKAGNPADAPQLAPAIDRVTKRAGRPPRKVNPRPRLRREAGRGRPARPRRPGRRIPRRGKPSAARRAAEDQRAFRRTVK